MKNLLIALDYSGASELVAQKGFDLAESMHANVTLVHVLSDITYYSSLNYSPILGFDSFSNMDIVQSNSRQELMEAATKFLDFFKDKYSESARVETVIEEGDFADQILKTATEKGSDVIVMGTHGRKGIDKMLMGSVAEKVLHKSDVPLFIIPIKNS